MRRVVSSRGAGLDSVCPPDLWLWAAAGTVGAVVKTFLVVLLVVLVAVTGLPIPMAMGMGTMAACQDCGPAVLVGVCAFAVLAAAAALALLLLVTRVRSRRDAIPLLLHSFLLERPPRLA